MFSNQITHSVVHLFEIVPNSKKLQTTTQLWHFKDFEIQIAWKTLWKNVKLLILSNFTFFHNVFLKCFSPICLNEYIWKKGSSLYHTRLSFDDMRKMPFEIIVGKGVNAGNHMLLLHIVVFNCNKYRFNNLLNTRLLISRYQWEWLMIYNT